jgi:mono/diheme cytochrome c family protein
MPSSRILDSGVVAILVRTHSTDKYRDTVAHCANSNATELKTFHLWVRKGALACAMLLRCYGLSLAGLGLLLFPVPTRRTIASVHGQAKSISPVATRGILHDTRSSPLDLEIKGELAGLPAESVRYITREGLQTLPQVSYLVTDDANFGEHTQVRGVELEVLARAFAAEGENAFIVAVCKDLYRGHYPQSYIQEHRPVLVLEINGEPPSGWPKSKEGSGSALGPYLISHPHFAPSFKILGHADLAQIPWGVVRLEFRTPEAVFGAIAPRSPNVSDPAVQAGYRIAQQNCFRCHAQESAGPQKSQFTWLAIAFIASDSPRTFSEYVRNPQSVAKYAQMPGNPSYDDATILALLSYFRTFFAQGKP